jgi:hypothetical protein
MGFDQLMVIGIGNDLLVDQLFQEVRDCAARPVQSSPKIESIFHWHH